MDQDTPQTPTPTPTVAAPKASTATVPTPAPMPKRKMPSLAEVRALRTQENEGVDFELRGTFPGFLAKVKRLTLADRVQFGMLPSAMQDRIVFALNASRQAPGASDALTKKRYIKNLTNNEDLANAVCLGGFIEPRLTEDIEEADEDAGVWFLGDIQISDRQAYLNWCLGNDEAAAGRLKSVPGESAGSLDGVEDDEDDGSTAV